jgi:uncharacterized protein (DUF1800 family)
LRQRVAFALSEMFVVSTNSVNARSVTTHQNTLANDAFRGEFLHHHAGCDAATLTDPAQRVRVATYLVITSSFYKVEH